MIKFMLISIEQHLLSTLLTDLLIRLFHHCSCFFVLLVFEMLVGSLLLIKLLVISLL